MICQKLNFLQKENTFTQDYRAQKVISLGNHWDFLLKADVKVNDIINIAPGPGNYRLPTEFGYYRSKHAKEE